MFMRSRSKIKPTCLAVFLTVAGVAQAQQGRPTIGYVYPAGGRQGTTFEVTVGGQFLKDIRAAVISGQGIRAEFVEHEGPLPPKQLEELRDKLKELRERKQATQPAKERLAGAARAPGTRPAWTAEDEEQMTSIMEKLQTMARSRSVPSLGDTVTLTVTIAPDAPPGERTLRLESPTGLTNPMVFCVGRLPERSKKVATGEERFGLSDDGPGRRRPKRSTVPEEPIDITLPMVVNGQITAGGRDRYRFTARKGQRIVVAVRARQLIPYLADAVPGWFQALVVVCDAKGKEVACADHNRFDPDPVVSCLIPADGQYVIDICDALYRGREDFVYRASIGQLPFVTSVFPLGGQTGTATAVQLTGWNLPKTQVAMNCRDRQPGIYPLWDEREPFLNRMLFAIDNLPECMAKGPIHEIDKAQAVDLPVIVNGRIEQPGAWDIFGFSGRAGQTVVVEVMARRLGSPLDSAVKMTDAQGKQLAFNDDYDDKTAGLLTHQADSYLSTKLPADGMYYVHICDVQRRAGPEYVYRLRISDPRPDFDLRIAPSAINVRGGETVPITVHAIRRDGFDGRIQLSLRDAPGGFAIGGATIPAGQDQARVTLSAPRQPPEEGITLSIEGHAKIAGRDVVHKALPADERMQAFASKHLVPADALEVCIENRPFTRRTARILSHTPLKIPAGGEALLEVSVPGGPFLRDVQVELNEPPEGIAIGRTETAGEGVIRIILRSDRAKAKAGLSGNLVFNAFAEKTPANGGQAGKMRVPLGALPAVPFAVIEAP